MILFDLLSKIIPQKIAYAHCDIPCGIYDPHMAQMAAHTVIRMTQFLGEIKRNDETKAEHDISRVTHVKEEHSNLLEEELETLRNDYFKPEHFKEHSNLETLIQEALKSSATARQEINMEAAKETLEKVLQISEIFFKTKGFTPVRVKSVYPTEGEIVTYK